MKNYFVGWTANLGVVPLFRLATFLLAPEFFFFLSLLVVVTHVLETIRQLLIKPSNRIDARHKCFIFNYSKLSLLPIKGHCVKALFGIIFGLCSCFNAHSLESSPSIVISIGESYELNLTSMSKFNIGNKDILNYRLNPKNNKLLIRGKKLGHTEILIWQKNTKVESFQVFIIRKNLETKFLNIAESISQIKLTAKLIFPYIKINGELNDFHQYQNYKKILEQNKDQIIDQVEITPQLKSSLLATVYTSFFDNFKDSISCRTQFSDLLCFYPENEAPDDSLIKFLTDKYKIQFIKNNIQQIKKNYSIKIKLIQMEQLDGEELRLGLEQISGNISDFLTRPMEKIIEQNQILLAQKKVKISTLAEPLIVTGPKHESIIQLGSEIPFKTHNAKKTDSVIWKFAGLKMKIQIENYGEKIKVNYETELTSPQIENGQVLGVSGNTEKSAIIIPLKTAYKIFQLTLKTSGQTIDQLPYLNAIPLLGELFKSKSSHQDYKSITGIIEVLEND